MAIPTLSSDEAAQMKTEMANASASAAVFQAQSGNQTARAAELAKVDAGFKKFFDYYDGLIKQYDNERVALDGRYHVTPIAEADLQTVASLQGGRLQPTAPATAIVRIGEFDQGNQAVNPVNELQYIINQQVIEQALVAQFNNTERTNKTAAVPGNQGTLNSLITQLQQHINGRISNLNLQLASLAANLDPEVGTELTTATDQVNASKIFLTNYLISTNISDSGISGLSSERVIRTNQNQARVALVVGAMTGRSKNYMDQRYTFANNRADLSTGSLRLQKAAEQTAATTAGFASSLTSQASSLGSILP